MLWHAQHGATAEKYREDCARRGAPIPAYLWPPEALPGISAWFLAFFELSTERRFAGGAIPWSAIEAWPVDPAEGDTFRRAIRDADRAYLEFLAKPEEDRKSLPVATGSILKRKKERHD